MKKTLYSTFILLCLGMAPVMAQITVTSADFGAVGFTAAIANDTLTSNVSAGSAGTAQTYHLDSLHADVLDTVTYVNPASTPFAVDFPSANRARVMTSAPGTYDYFIIGPANVQIIGEGIPAGVFTSTSLAAHLTPPTIPITFPCNYLQHDTGTSHTSIQFDTLLTITPLSFDSVRISITTHYDITYDGWGSLSTPMGTYPNTLRQRQLNHETDSIFGHLVAPPMWTPLQVVSDSSLKYTWYANYYGYSMAEVNMDSTFNNVSSGSYSKIAPSGIAAMNESANLNIYPNPVSNVLHFNFETRKSGNIDIRVTNILGESVSEKQIAVETLHVTSLLDVKTLTPGIYFINISDADGNVSAKKFVKE